MAAGAHLRVNIKCQIYTLDEKTPSLVQFKILPSSKHCQIWGTSGDLEIRTQIMSNLVQLTEDQFVGHETNKTFNIISRLLPSCIDLETKVRKIAVSKIICEALDILTEFRNSRGNKKWVMHVDIRIITKHDAQKDQEQDPVEEFLNCRFVPAALSSIGELKKKILGGESSSTGYCTICMEKIPIGYVVTYMPCSHVFHGQCLFLWLNRSHFCPCCRFKMPVPNLRII